MVSFLMFLKMFKYASEITKTNNGFEILDRGYPIITPISNHTGDYLVVYLLKGLKNIDPFEFITSYKAFYEFGRIENEEVCVKMTPREANMKTRFDDEVLITFPMTNLSKENYLKVYFVDNYGKKRIESMEYINHGKPYYSYYYQWLS